MNAPATLTTLDPRELDKLENEVRSLEEKIAMWEMENRPVFIARINSINTIFLEIAKKDLPTDPYEVKVKLVNSLFFKINLNQEEKEAYFWLTIDEKLDYLYQRIDRITYKALWMSLPENFLKMSIQNQCSILSILLIRESKRYTPTSETTTSVVSEVYKII